MDNEDLKQATMLKEPPLSAKDMSAKNMLEVVIQKLADIEQREAKRDIQFKTLENALTKVFGDKEDETAKTDDYIKLLIKNVANIEQVILSLSKEIVELRKLDATKDLINELASFRKIMTAVLQDIPSTVEQSLSKQEKYLEINNKSVEQNNKIIERFESMLNTVNDAEMIELKKTIETSNKNVALTSDLLHNAIKLKSTESEERDGNSWLKTLLKKK